MSGFSALESANPIVTIQFPNEITIDNYSIALFDTGVNSTPTTGYTMEYSLDGVTYQVADTQANLTVTRDKTFSFALGEPIPTPKITGFVKEGSTPVSRKVRLYLQSTGAFVSETTSAADGSYSFLNLTPNTKYFVVSHDSNGIYNAAISDNLTAS